MFGSLAKVKLLSHRTKHLQAKVLQLRHPLIIWQKSKPGRSKSSQPSDVHIATRLHSGAGQPLKPKLGVTGCPPSACLWQHKFDAISYAVFCLKKKIPVR